MNPVNLLTEKYLTKMFLSKKKISDFPDAEKLYSLLNITEEIAEKANIRVLDEAHEDDLILVHYFSSTEVFNSVSHIRGIVIDMGGETPTIVAKSFPHTPEFGVEECNVFDPEENIVTHAFEGTIIRVFKGRKTRKWYISTHRKINGRNSKWCGPTFGKIFDELWGSPDSFSLDDYLQEDTCYIFLISHPENKLVCDTPSPTIRLVGKYIPCEGVLLSDPKYLNLIQPHPNVIIQSSLNVKDKDDLFNLVHLTNWKECSGLIVYDKNRQTCYKLVHHKYFERKEIRGNEPNLRLRYLQHLKSDTTEKLFELFPEKMEYFEEVKINYNSLKFYLENLYINRYRNGDDCILPKEEHFILEKTRRNYDPALTLPNNINIHVESSNPRHINALIKHMCKNRNNSSV